LALATSIIAKTKWFVIAFLLALFNRAGLPSILVPLPVTFAFCRFIGVDAVLFSANVSILNLYVYLITSQIIMLP